MKTWKKYLPDVVAVVIFAVISFAYFMPADFDGRILYHGDSSAGTGSGHETQLFEQQTGEHSRWTNSIFSGMPTYQMSPSYKSTHVLGVLTQVYHLGLPDYVWYVFAYLLGFYILLRAFAFRRSLAAAGAVVWAFSSYFFIIIAAGHIWKVWALAYLPPMIAGIVLAYRGRYLWGLVLTALFGAFEINANHVQMTYYYLFIILFMVIAFLVQAIREHKLAQFGKATLACLGGALIAVCINASNLYHTWQYSQESMRGKSELVKKNTANQTSSGLDRDYITQWSYGIDETWTLLIPNAKGGASVPMSQNKIVQEKGDPQLMQAYQQIGQYWGDQPGTSGPVYVGAFVLLLFVLGLFIVKGPMKWALLAATVLSILLSWGRNLMGFTNFFLDYIPMYAKFRTVASILVIAEFTIPLLAMMALKKIVDDPSLLRRKRKWVVVSLVLTAGPCLLFALFPGIFSYIPSAEQQQFGQIAAQGQEASQFVGMLTASLVELRKAIFTSDCWRSLLVIAIGTVCLVLYGYRKLRAIYLVGAIGLLCLVDMWQVNKRYLYDDMFVEKSVRDNPVQMTDTDRQILRDKSLDYRVLNLASNTFNENETSYYHKSIGGYHAAKLHRYQDLIEAYIAPEMQRMMPVIAQAGGDMTKVNGDSIFPVLNMLNTKYFIMGLQGGQTIPIQNPYAYGNAWIVDKVDYVDNANEEIATVGKLALRHEAVADKKYQPALGPSKQQGQVSRVTMDSYKPNHLEYTVETDKGGVVVFSEIYYPEWTATIDGRPRELGRVDYVLRALNVEAGKHKVVLDFHPASVGKTEATAYVGYGLLLVLVVVAVLSDRKRKPSATSHQAGEGAKA